MSCFALFYPYGKGSDESTLVFFEDNEEARDAWIQERQGFLPEAVAEAVAPGLDPDDEDLVWDYVEEIENSHPEWFDY